MHVCSELCCWALLSEGAAAVSSLIFVKSATVMLLLLGVSETVKLYKAKRLSEELMTASGVGEKIYSSL